MSRPEEGYRSGDQRSRGTGSDGLNIGGVSEIEATEAVV